jgi:hypothetical protein
MRRGGGESLKIGGVGEWGKIWKERGKHALLRRREDVAHGPDGQRQSLEEEA